MIPPQSSAETAFERGDDPALAARRRATFDRYAAAFSAADGALFGSFYTDEVVLELPGHPPLRGRAAIVDFYTAMADRVRETLSVERFACTDAMIAAELVSTFTAHADAPDFIVCPLARGESVAVRVFVHYALDNGRIGHIRVARAGPPTHYGA